VCFTYNLLSLYQHASAPEQRKAGFRRPATLRAAVFIGGAVLGTRSRTPVLYITESWGGLDKHKPLMDNILQWPGATSPKLPPEPPDVDRAGLNAQCFWTGWKAGPSVSNWGLDGRLFQITRISSPIRKPTARW
jgi:hypothetical protein